MRTMVVRIILVSGALSLAMLMIWLEYGVEVVVRAGCGTCPTPKSAPFACIYNPVVVARF